MTEQRGIEDMPWYELLPAAIIAVIAAAIIWILDKGPFFPRLLPRVVVVKREESEDD